LTESIQRLDQAICARDARIFRHTVTVHTGDAENAESNTVFPETPQSERNKFKVTNLVTAPAWLLHFAIKCIRMCS
jgi:hypothetical protein